MLASTLLWRASTEAAVEAEVGSQSRRRVDADEGGVSEARWTLLRGCGNLSGNVSPSAPSLAKIVVCECSRRTAAARALASPGAKDKLSPPPMPSASASATASTTAWSPGMYLKRPTCVKKKWCQSAGRVSILWRGLTDVPGDRRGALGIILGTVRADGARWRKMRKVGQLPQMQGSLKDYPQK